MQVGCKICKDPIAKEINADLLTSGIPLIRAAAKWGFNEDTIHKHVKQCLGRTTRELADAPRISNAADVEKRYQYAMNEAQNMYLAAKDVLLVDGDLCLDPRSWEITVIYADYNDIHPDTGQARIKSSTLDDLLGEIAGHGAVVKHSYVKTEDARKGLRDAFTAFVGVIDRFGKMFGVFQQDRPNERGEIEDIRRAITRTSLKMGTSYAYELNRFLQDEGDRVRGDLRGMLEIESQSLSGALPARGEEVKPLHLPSPQNPQDIEIKEVTPPTPSSPPDDPKKNSQENFDRRPVFGIKCDCGLEHDGTTDELLLEWTCTTTGALRQGVDA